jgi:hypothetical protein
MELFEMNFYKKFILTFMIINSAFLFAGLCEASENVIAAVILERTHLSGLDHFRWETIYKGKGSITEVSKEEIFDFVKNSGVIDEYAIQRGAISISKFKVVDINNDGLYDVVFPIDEECTSCPTQLWCITFKKPELYLYQFDTEMGGIVDVRDLNSDKQFEIITHIELTSSNSHAEAVRWDDIYSWNGTTYAKANKKFPDYYIKEYISIYEKRLKSIIATKVEEKASDWDISNNREKAIAEAAQWKENAISDLTLAIDKAKRTAGIDPKAGFNVAIKWTKSKNENLRRNAIKVFEDIRDSQSTKAILKSTEDSSPWVRSDAVMALSHIDKNKFLPTFKKMLNDQYQAPSENFGPDHFPVRETARSILNSMGIKVVGEKGQYKVNEK